MLLTVTWPTSSPSQVTMNGSSAPARPSRRSELSVDVQLAAECRAAHDWEEVGSHGASQASLAIRRVLHAEASRRRGGRSPTRPYSSLTGHPGCRLIGRCPVLVTTLLPGLSGTREQQRQDGDLVALRHLGDLLVDHDEAVRLGEAGQQVRAGTADRLGGVSAVRLSVQ